MQPYFKISFNFKKDLEKSILCFKDKKIYFVPKSIIKSKKRYKEGIILGKYNSFELEKIDIFLPKWYCEKNKLLNN